MVDNPKKKLFIQFDFSRESSLLLSLKTHYIRPRLCLGLRALDTRKEGVGRGRGVVRWRCGGGAEDTRDASLKFEKDGSLAKCASGATKIDR